MKPKFVRFMTKMNPNNGSETKPNIFQQDMFKSGMIFIGHKMLNYFSRFYNYHISNDFIAKVSTNK